MKKGFVRVCISFLIISISFGFTRVLAENNESIKNEIDNNKDRIEELEKEKEEIQDEILSEEEALKRIEEEIKEKREELLKVSKEVEVFQNEIDLIQEEVDKIEDEILKIEEEISIKEEKIENLIKEQEKQKVLLANRLRNYYKLDISNQYLYMILSSENIFELLNKLYNITILMKIDRDLMKSNKESEENITLEKNAIEEYLKEEEIRKNDVVKKQIELIDKQSEFIVIKEKEEKQMYELQALESEKNNLIVSLEGVQNSLQNQIEDLLSYNEELQAELDRIFEDIENGSPDNGATPESGNESGFLRPVDGVITCEFGPRINPVTFEAGFHNGIDYAGNTGEAIRATKSGVVEYSGWIEGYGYTIILNHGDGIKSLYAHSSQLIVSVGNSVQQGETVALIGSTGMSTGPHLHFEIRVNGQPVDPFGYIPY
ncbi:peptidoglycan DD-metalloendopeptidase family protein [Clostridium sp. NSJ-6]|uniref:Peptidoglycan DD-metalloendopeptidase family protein n=1 Tax=Clostridium hominis TaxID=2763036 RepID=A0ABR7DF76_9CLOT|nr:peptidoglycan DD-metalloendopeptidase family protein [Clostridium hominis]MBC5630060.1 peptidoglycan DD-metalloendopeptidase family protein [Clostridium hominis]